MASTDETKPLKKKYNVHLKDLEIRQAKPKAKKYRLADGGGLCLEVLPNGSKTWRLRYRHPHTQKDRELVIGRYPDVSAKEARVKAVEAKKNLADGDDPAELKQAQKRGRREAYQNTFALLADEWFSKRANDWAPATRKKQRAFLDKDLLPYLGKKPISELEIGELISTVERVAKRGALDTAHKCCNTIKQVFLYAQQTGRIKSNPALALVKVLPKKQDQKLAAIIEPRAFGKLLVAIDTYKGSHIIRTMLALAPLVFQRPIEVASMEWLELDLEAGYWTIPKEKKKERRKREEDHIVPLSKQALALIKDIQPLTGHRQYVFTGVRDYSKHANPESVNKALRALGYNTSTDHCFHGFRSSACTMLDERLGFRTAYIEHQLAHTVKGPLGDTYNRTKHLSQRVAMMQRWADYLDDLKAQTLAGNVITGNFGSA